MARDYAAIYARRKARAATAGTTVYQRRNVAAEARGFASEAERRRLMKEHRPAARAGRVALGAEGQENVYTRNEAQLRAAFRRAADNDLRVTARVTVLIDGERREVELWAKGGWSASTAFDYADALGAMNMIQGALANMPYGQGPILDVELRAVA